MAVVRDVTVGVPPLWRVTGVNGVGDGGSSSPPEGFARAMLDDYAIVTGKGVGCHRRTID